MPTAVPPVVASAPVVPPSNVPNPDAPDIQSPPMSAGSVLSGATPGPTNPRATFKNSFQAGLQRPKYTTDDQGQISRVNEGTSSPKGFLGSVLAGAVVGALHGAAATKRGQRGGAAFGSGVAEDQKIRDEQAQQGQKLAQQNFQNKQSVQKATDEHAQAVLTANHMAALTQQTINQTKYEEENHPYELKAKQLGVDELGQSIALNSQKLQQDSLTLAENLASQGINPDVVLTNYADAQSHIKDIVSGTHGPLPNGKPSNSDDFGANLYKLSDFQRPLTQDVSYYTYDKADKNGNPIPEKHTLLGDGTHTVAQYVAAAMQSHAQLIQSNTQLKDKIDNAEKVAQTNKANDEGIKALSESRSADAGINDANRGLKGEAFVSTLPAHMQDTIRAMGHYQYDPKDLPRGKERQPYVDALLHAYGDSGWSEAKYNQRYHYLQTYGDSRAGDGATRFRANNAISHLALLDQSSQALSQNNLPLLNSIANQVGALTGGSAKLVADSIASKAAGELAGAIKGGSGQATDPGIESALKSLNTPGMNPAQRHKIIQTQMELLDAPVKSIEDKFTDAMGQTPSQFGQPVVSSANKQILDQWLGRTPKGATQVIKGSDGKDHYASAQGQDLGAVQ